MSKNRARWIESSHLTIRDRTLNARANRLLHSKPALGLIAEIDCLIAHRYLVDPVYQLGTESFGEPSFQTEEAPCGGSFARALPPTLCATLPRTLKSFGAYSIRPAPA